MSPRVADLVATLDQETVLVLQLVEVLQADQQRVVKRDIQGLEDSLREKEALVVRLQAAEQIRLEVTGGLGTDLGLAHEELRISKICPLLGPGGAPLERAAEKLRASVGSLAELIAVSRGFLEQSILGIRSVLTLIQSLRTPGPSTYDASGQFIQPPESEAMAFRREV